MNRQAGELHPLRRESAPHFKGPGAMKRGLFYPHRRRLRAAPALPAALAFPAAALLLASCDPPASPRSASREVSRVEATITARGVTEAVHKKPDGTVMKSEETTPAAEGGERVVTEGPDDKGISRVETKKDGSTITTTPTAEGGTLAVHKNPAGTETQRVETRSDKSTITTTPAPGGGFTRELVIHSSVTAIGDYAFRNNQLTSLTIGNGVKTIGVGAFAENPKLKTVRITGTGAVESNAFTYKDTSLSRKGILNQSGSSGIELIIEDGITAIGEGAFAYNDLTSLTIGNGVRSIGEYAFRGSKLTSVVIPPSVTAIERGAFWENRLTSLTIGNGVKTIGAGAFAENPKLKTVRITGTGPVESNAFTYMNTTHSHIGIFTESRSLGIELIIEDGITAIGEEAFSWNKLTSLTMGNGLKTIGRGAFSYNDLTSLRIPPSVTAIEEGAFYRNQLTSLTIGNGVKTIGRDAFSGNLLTSLRIPPSVTAIEEGAFSGNLLTSVTLSKALYKARGNAFNGNPVHLPRTSPLFYDHKGRYLGTN